MAHGDVDPVAVEIADRTQREIFADEVRALDVDVRFGEGDVLGAFRIDGEERDVPGARPHRVRHLARRFEPDIAQRKAQAFRQFADERWPDAARDACAASRWAMTGLPKLMPASSTPSGAISEAIAWIAVMQLLRERASIAIRFPATASAMTTPRDHPPVQ